MTTRVTCPPLRALSTLALALSSAGVFAQTPAPAAEAASAPASTPSEAVTLPAVRVRSAADTERALGPVSGYNARRSATATRTDTPLNEVPQSITVIGAEQVRDQNSLTIQEVLRYTPGVNSETYGLDNRGDYFAVRGSDGTTLLDGLRLPITGYWGAVRNEPFAFERIEVLRGPASLLAGQNAPGGLINMVSKRPLFQPAGELQVQVGNDNHRIIAGDLTGPIGDDGRLAYRVVALGKDAGTQVDWADQQRQLFAPSLTWKPLNGTTVTVYGEYQRDRSRNTNAFFPVEGTLLPGPRGLIPISTFIGEPDWDTYGGSRQRYGWEIEHKVGNDWTLRHRARSDHVKGDMINSYAAWYEGWVNSAGVVDADPANNTFLNRVGSKQEDKSRVLNADFTVEGKLKLGRSAHTVLAGFDYIRHRSDHTDFATSAAGGFAMTPLDPYNPVYNTSPLPAAFLSQTTASEIKNVGVLLQDQIKIDDRWVIVAGVRHDKAESGADRDEATSKNFGVVYLANGGWSPYAGYSESFSPVAGTDRFDQPFEPSRGKQLEAGVKWMPADSRVSAAVAVYSLKESNLLASDPVDPNKSIQLGEATTDGVELEANAKLTSWDLLGNYSYTRSRLTGSLDANQGLQRAGIRKHAASAWAIHRFGGWALPGLRAGGGVRYIGSSTDGAGGNRVPEVTLLDLLVSYETGPWTLSLNVNNVTDKTYIATCLERGDCWFGVKRRGVLTAAYRW